MTRQPDFLAAEARRWVTGHRGARTAEVNAVLRALRSYYADLVVVEGIVKWHEDRCGAIA